MKIKNLENAENLPVKESMRRSSDYDSWDCYHVCGRGYYSWLKSFVIKSVGQPFNDVYSKFKKSLSKKHLSQKDYDEMVWYFKKITNYNEYRYKIWPNEVYVDEDGILRKKPRKTKSRDVTIRYGEPVTEYKIKGEYREALFSYLAISFGYKKACSMIKNGIQKRNSAPKPTKYADTTI